MTLAKIFSAGITEAQPAHLQNKIRTSNIISLIIALGVGAPFTVISLIYFPPLVLVPVLGAIVSLGCIVLNAWGAVTFGRASISLIPLLLAATYNAGLSSVSELPIVGVYMVELSFSIIVFLVFDMRERRYLFSLVGIALLIIMSFHYTKGWWEPPVDSTIAREGFIGIVATFTGVICSFGFIFALVYQNQLSENKAVKLLAEAEEIHQKRLQSEHELHKNLDQLKSSQEMERKRQWAAEGLAEATKILRQYDDITQLYDHLISYIVHYIGANQGGLFIVEEEGGDHILQLKACYAYERKKYIQKRLEIGEGLVGQAYLEKEPIYMTEIPENFANITSGLGKASPRNLLIVPLITNENIEGVIELASFKKMEEHEIRFIQAIGENIASAVRSVKTNQKTKELLSDSQQQTEEMRAQEEEMRQNMEELQATQEEMTRKQKEMEQIKLNLEMKQQEIDKVRKSEKERAEAKIATQKKSMNSVLEKMKEKENSYQKTMEEQEKLITALRQQINN